MNFKDPIIIEKIVAEFFNTYKTVENDEAFISEAALFIEDVFGILLEDADINNNVLKDRTAIVNFLMNKF